MTRMISSEVFVGGAMRLVPIVMLMSSSRAEPHWLL